MSCENCTKLKDLIRCNTNIDFGTYTATTAINVYFKDLGTGQMHVVELTTDGSGNIDVTPDFSFRNGQTYKVWLNETNGTLSDEKQWTLADGTTTLTCGLVRFLDLYSGGSRDSETTVTLEA